MGKTYEQIIEEKLNPYLSEHGFELVDIEYVKEGGQWFLRIFVDKPGGIDLDDCGLISEYLSEKLDEDDPIPTTYYLEVSSPGAERPLKETKDFYHAINKHVYMTTYEPIHGLKQFEGTLLSYDEQQLVIEVNERGRKKQYELPTDKIAHARLAVLI